MHTSILHINTSFLPVFFGGAAIVMHITGRGLKHKIMKGISYRLFMLTFLITTLTCGFGGASIRAVEFVAGIDPIVVKIHAWTAMMVFILSAIMAYYSYIAIRGKGKETKSDRIILIVSSVFLILFACTIIVAFRIR